MALPGQQRRELREYWKAGPKPGKEGPGDKPPPTIGGGGDWFVTKFGGASESVVVGVGYSALRGEIEFTRANGQKYSNAIGLIGASAGASVGPGNLFKIKALQNKFPALAQYFVPDDVPKLSNGLLTWMTSSSSPLAKALWASPNVTKTLNALRGLQAERNALARADCRAYSGAKRPARRATTETGTMSTTGGAPKDKRKLRSKLWFDNPDNPGMTALYIERYLNFGLTPGELRSGKPIIGIAQTGSDLSPCNRHHIELAKRVRDGILAAGGVPFEFPVHPIQETGKRPTAALDRNLAYLGLVETLYGYFIDGVVLTTGCDKTTPACIMAAATVNLPAIVLSGGPMLNGWHNGERTGSGTIVWKAREELAAGKIDYEEFMEIVTSSAPSVGHCNTMGTASTMNALAEALGMSLPGCAAIPAPHRERGQIAYETGKRIVDMVWEDLKPSDIMTREGARERHRRQLRHRRLDQRDRSTSTPSPAMSACKLDIDDWETRRPPRAAAGQHAAGRQISRRGVPSRRRRAGRRQRADEAEARPRGRADRQRQDDRRELRATGRATTPT